MARKINFDLQPEAASSSVENSAPAEPTFDRPLMSKPPVRTNGALGAISNSLGGINDRVKRAEEIEQKLLRGQVVVELDPAVVDGSFVPDRMDSSVEDRDAFRDLIGTHGQNVPILVRPHPQNKSRYEVAFGHRRLRAARDLGIPVKAVIRDLTDEQLVIAQGQENSGRTDLTFIEKALFAARLENRGFSREVIMSALNVDKAALSRLIQIATDIPAEITSAIGPAPDFGRIRWFELRDLLVGRTDQAFIVIQEEKFTALASNQRFEKLVLSLRSKIKSTSGSKPERWTAPDGEEVAVITRAPKKFKIQFDERIAPAFGDFVTNRLQGLYEEYKSKNTNEDHLN